MKINLPQLIDLLGEKSVNYGQRINTVLSLLQRPRHQVTNQPFMHDF